MIGTVVATACSISPAMTISVGHYFLQWRWIRRCTRFPNFIPDC